MENFQITDSPQSLGLWFSKSWQKWNISIGHYDKVEKFKNGDLFINIDHTEKLVQFSPSLILGSISTLVRGYT